MQPNPSAPAVTPPGESASDDRLDSWKGIASYLKRDVRTVQRWEKREGLPVHRHLHDKLGSVYASKRELDEWWKGGHNRIEQAETTATPRSFLARSTHLVVLGDVPASIKRRYEVEGQVGRGGMGVVYKARDRETGDIVALKVLRPELARDPEVLERFKGELRLSRKVTHKRVCRIHEFVRTEDCAYISMEFVEGESLRQILNRFGMLNVRTSMAITRQICSGLDEAHDQGVIHRDLKPENVMLDHNGDIKLMDFGIACSGSGSGKDGDKIFGTPAYMAPEQAQGRPAERRSDIYAVGLILYEMVTGRPAFTGDTPLVIIKKQLRDTPPSPRSVEASIPERVERVILRALEKSPDNRFSSALEMSDALVDSGEAAPVLDASQTAELLLPPTASRWSWRDTMMLGLGVLGAAAFLYLFTAIFPYSRYRLGISRMEAIARADSIVRRYAPEFRHDVYAARFDAGFQMLQMPLMVRQDGLRQTLETASQSGSSWSISTYKPGNPDTAFSETSPQTTFDVEGQLQSLSFPALSTENAASGTEALATKYAEDLFDVSLRSAAARRFVYDAAEHVWIGTMENGFAPVRLTATDPRVNPFEWVWTDPDAEHQYVRVWLAGERMLAAEESPIDSQLASAPGHWKPRTASVLRTGFSGAVFCGVLFLFIARKMYLRRSRPLVLAALLVGIAFSAVIAATPTEDGPSLKGLAAGPHVSAIGWSAMLFLVGLIGIMFYAVLAVPYLFANDSFPERLASFRSLAKGEYCSRSVGLSIIRGALAGACLLGLYAVALLILGRFGLGSFAPLPSDLLAGSPGNALISAVGRSFSGGIVDTWIMILLPFALLHRLVKQPWISALACAMVGVLAANPLDGTDMLPAAASYVATGIQVFLLGFVFWQFDLLACMTAAFTIETFVLVYPITRVYGQIAPSANVIGFAPWVLLLLAGVVIWIMPPLRTGYRLLTAEFS